MTGDLNDHVNRYVHIPADLLPEGMDPVAVYLDHSLIMEGQRQLAEQQEALADVVLGTAKVSYDGSVEREGGLKALIADSENGGLKIKLPTSIIVALITQTGGIIAALILLLR